MRAAWEVVVDLTQGGGSVSVHVIACGACANGRRGPKCHGRGRDVQRRTQLLAKVLVQMFLVQIAYNNNLLPKGL